MSSTRKLVITSLFAALICAATMSVRIPVPVTGGYIHPGDAIVILSGLFLGPCRGFLASGIGSCMADLLGGYLVYAPITFVVKGTVALFCALISQTAHKKGISRNLAVVFGGCADILFVCGGYFLFEAVLYGVSGAAAAVIPNVIQGTGGLIIASVFFPLLYSIPEMRLLMDESCR